MNKARRSFCLAVGVVVLALPAAKAFAWAADHSHGPIQFGEGAPKGLNEVIGHKTYVGGYFLNEFDSFAYAGDAEAFNDFIARYGEAQLTTHTLVLHPGRGRGGSISPERMRPIDWAVGVHRARHSMAAEDFSVSVSLYLGGDVDLRQIKVPLNVNVISSGEIEKFIREHNARRAAEGRADAESSRPPQAANLNHSGSESVSVRVSPGETGPKPAARTDTDSHGPSRISEAPFALYLLADSSLNAHDALRLDFERLPLAAKPLLTIDDFTSYSWSDHTFGLTPEAQTRVPPVKSVWGVPFVITSHGKRLYLGAFYTSVSSASFPNPVIDVFGIGSIQPWQFARAYPGAIEGDKRPDPRENPAIKKAFEEAGKLR